ncbi:Hypothetical predicted protein [Mytilus galloprovincialis]|uniref:B box-type domain-containing protein n=1 Tax=Mytilus galloprovincialis TaxID=29158 RepID=A0A8B6HNR3_MYTGA|nr:Hypothetical predicted protein [Mytilus galloprovincialis]
MATASRTFCGVCETQHVAKEAAFWCPECDEGICTSCGKHHRASKGTRNHEITSIYNYKQIPPTIACINQYCPEHDKKFQHFCSQHEKLCCPLCITTCHKKCDLFAIDFKLFDIMEQSLKEMKNNIDRIVKDRKQNLEEIKQQRLRFQAEIKEIRDKINIHLDKLEQEILQDIEAAEQNVMSQIKRCVFKVSDHEKTIDELPNSLSATKSFATDLQTFFGGKVLDAKIQSEERFMVSLLEDRSLQQINLQCRMDDKMWDILSMTQIGDIYVVTKPPAITIKTDRENQAQKILPPISKTIDHINLISLKRFEVSKGKKRIAIAGCTIMPSGNIVFVDQNNDRLIIHNENGLFVCEIPVSHWPVGVTWIDKNTVAVTHNAEPNHIEIVNIVNKKIVNQIKTSNLCYGITNEKGELIYYEKGRGIQTADVNSKNTATTVVKVDGKYAWNYVTISKGKIYHTNSETGIVTCYRCFTGQKVWEIQRRISCGIGLWNSS